MQKATIERFQKGAFLYTETPMHDRYQRAY